MGDSLDPSKLKVAELRAELQARGLDTKGNKPVLVERLKEALEEQQANDDHEEEAEVKEELRNGYGGSMKTEEIYIKEDITVKEEVEDEYYETDYEDAPMQDMSDAGDFELETDHDEQDDEEEENPDAPDSDSEHENESLLELEPEHEFEHEAEHDEPVVKDEDITAKEEVEDEYYETDYEDAPMQDMSVSTTPPSPTPSTSRAQPPAFERLAPVEERKRGELQPARGTPIRRIKAEMIQGCDGTRWHRDPNPALPHIFTPWIEPGGPTSATVGARKMSEIFSLFLDDQMLAEIVLLTNDRLALLRGHFPHEDIVPLRDLDLRELKALIGILIMSAVRHDSHTPTSDMWDFVEYNPLYLCSMSETRFALLLRVLRFDDPATRAERAKIDRLAPIRKLFDHVVANCQRNYRPGPHLTMGDQLVPFRGRCPFRMYMPNKPAKFGIKLVLACDADSHYMCNAITYLGKDTVKVPSGTTLGEVFTSELVAPFHRRGRTVTTGNFFTALPLALALMDKGMHLCGTISQKPYTPKELYEKVLPIKDSVAVFNYEHNLTLQCQQVNRTQKVMLLSSLHPDPSELDKKKTDIQMFYNSTKGGVDTFNQLCATSNCVRKTRRWSLCLFYGLLNIIMVNSYILYSSMPFSKTMPRRNFLKEIATELCFPLIEHRFYTSTKLSKRIRLVMQDTFKLVEADPRPAVACGHIKLPKRIRCQSCPSKDDHKTNTACLLCKKPVCLQHQTVLCPNCV